MSFIDTSSPSDMGQVSLGCWAIGMLTIFRPSFLLLIELTERLRITSENIYILEEYILIASYLWFALIIFVLFFLGFIPMFAASVKKRWALLIHPWAMLLLYFDSFIWFTITTLLFVGLNKESPGAVNTIKHVRYTAVYFSIIYLDIVVYWVIYYVYVTYFIVAELTIIEKFY